MEERRKHIFTALATSKYLLLQTMVINLVESDNSDDEMEYGIGMYLSMGVQDRTKRIRLKGFVERIISQFNSTQFQEHFRMNPTSFERLENMVGGRLSAISKISVRKQLLAIVWLLSTPDSYRSVSLKFDLGKSSLHSCFQKVVAVLNEIAENIIIWPSGEKLKETKEIFRQIGGLTDIIGAIDGTFIKIKAPQVDSQYYMTRKKFHAVVLQGVCSKDLVFTDCFIGYPGSVGDLRIFRNSDLYKDAKANLRALFPNGEYIIGDKAYPVLSWCIPSYINRQGNLRRLERRVQERFNARLSKTRQVIERAFALLKGRFRRLKYLDMDRLDLIPATILACCVLHNICLRNFENDNNLENYIEEGMEIVDEEPELHDDDNDRNEIEGIAKRDYIAITLQ